MYNRVHEFVRFFSVLQLAERMIMAKVFQILGIVK